MSDISENARMRERSGSVSSSDPIISFIYLLSRDHLTPGKVESIIDEATKCGGKVVTFTNGWLAQYAEDVAARLKGGV